MTWINTLEHAKMLPRSEKACCVSEKKQGWEFLPDCNRANYGSASFCQEIECSLEELESHARS